MLEIIAFLKVRITLICKADASIDWATKLSGGLLSTLFEIENGGQPDLDVELSDQLWEFFIEEEKQASETFQENSGGTSSTWFGRGASDDWKLLGYLEAAPRTGFPAPLSHGEFYLGQLLTRTALHGASSFSLEFVKWLTSIFYWTSDVPVGHPSANTYVHWLSPLYLLQSYKWSW